MCTKIKEGRDAQLKKCGKVFVRILIINKAHVCFNTQRDKRSMVQQTTDRDSKTWQENISNSSKNNNNMRKKSRSCRLLYSAHAHYILLLGVLFHLIKCEYMCVSLICSLILLKSGPQNVQQCHKFSLTLSQAALWCTLIFKNDCPERRKLVICDCKKRRQNQRCNLVFASTVKHFIENVSTVKPV